MNSQLTLEEALQAKLLNGISEEELVQCVKRIIDSGHSKTDSEHPFELIFTDDTFTSIKKIKTFEEVEEDWAEVRRRHQEMKEEKLRDMKFYNKIPWKY